MHAHVSSLNIEQHYPILITKTVNHSGIPKKIISKEMIYNIAPQYLSFSPDKDKKSILMKIPKKLSNV
jgi:hypothetical protein